MTEFDGWRDSPVGQWFFLHVLPGLADAYALENGRSIGNLEETSDRDYLTHVRNAGVIQGIEHAATLDPFEEERDEIESRRTLSTGQDEIGSD